MKAGPCSINLGMTTVTTAGIAGLQRAITLMPKCISAEQSRVSCCILVVVQDMSPYCDCVSDSLSPARLTEGPPMSGPLRQCAVGDTIVCGCGCHS